jgi:hypothetical protein
VVALLARPRAALYVALAFWLPFAALSGVVPTKQPRYVAHLLPFLWLLEGAAAAAVAPSAAGAVRRAVGRLLPRAPAWLVGAAPALAAIVALAPVVRLTPSAVQAARRPTERTGAFTGGVVADWRAGAATLLPQLPADAQLLSRPLASRYYLGRPATPLGGPDDGPDDASDRTVRDAADLGRLRAGGPVYLVVERLRWEAPGKFDPGLVAAVRSGCREIALTAAAGLVAFACEAASREATGREATGREAGAARSRPASGPAPSDPGRPRGGGSPRAGSPP